MKNLKLDWPGVAVFAVAVIAAVVVGIWVDLEAAKVVAGIAGGLLLKIGAVGLGGDGIAIDVEEERK